MNLNPTATILKAGDPWSEISDYERYQESMNQFSEFLSDHRKQKEMLEIINQEKIQKLFGECKFFINNFRQLLDENYKLKDQIIDFKKKTDTIREILSTIVEDVDVMTNENRSLQKQLVSIDKLIEFIQSDYHNYRQQLAAVQDSRNDCLAEMRKLFSDHQLMIRSYELQIDQVHQIYLEAQQEERKKQEIILNDMKELNQTLNILRIENMAHMNKIEKQKEEINNYDTMLTHSKKREVQMHQKMTELEKSHERNLLEQQKKHKEELKVYKSQQQIYLNQVVGQLEEKISILTFDGNKLTEELTQTKFKLNETERNLSMLNDQYQVLLQLQQKRESEYLQTTQQNEKTIQQLIERSERYDLERKTVTAERDDLWQDKRNLEQALDEKLQEIKQYAIKLQNKEAQIKSQAQQHKQTVEQLKKDHETQIKNNKIQFDLSLQDQLQSQANEFNRKLQAAERQRVSEVTSLNNQLRTSQRLLEEEKRKYEADTGLLRKDIDQINQDFDSKLNEQAKDFKMQHDSLSQHIQRLEHTNQTLLSQIHAIERKFDEEKVELVKRYGEIIKSYQIDQDELARKIKKPLEDIIADMELSEKNLIKENRENHLTISTLNTQLKELQERYSRDIQQLKNQLATTIQNSELKSENLLQELEQIKEGFQTMQMRKQRLLDEFRDKDHQIKLQNRQILDMRTNVENVSKQFKLKMIEQEDKFQAEREKAEKNTWRLSDDLRIANSKVKQLEAQIKKTISEQSDWGPEKFRSRMDQEIKIFEHKQHELKETFDKQMKIQIEIKERLQNEVREQNRLIAELQKATNSMEQVWMARMEEQLRNADQILTQTTLDYENKLKDIQIRLTQELEQSELRASRLSREEISRLTIKYEALLDQLKKKVQQLKEGNIDHLSEEGKLLGLQIQKLQDELDAEREAHEQTKNLINEERQKNNKHLNDLNTKFHIVFEEQRSQNNEMVQHREKLKEQNRLLEQQLNEQNQEFLRQQEQIVQQYEAKMKQEFGILMRENEKLQIEFNNLKELYNHKVNELSEELEVQKRLVEERPSRPEDVSLIKKLLAELNEHKHQVNTANDKVKEAGDIIKYMDLELQNYKQNHEIFGQQRQESKSSSHSAQNSRKSNRELIQRVSYLSQELETTYKKLKDQKTEKSLDEGSINGNSRPYSAEKRVTNNSLQPLISLHEEKEQYFPSIEKEVRSAKTRRREIPHTNAYQIPSENERPTPHIETLNEQQEIEQIHTSIRNRPLSQIEQSQTPDITSFNAFMTNRRNVSISRAETRKNKYKQYLENKQQMNRPESKDSQTVIQGQIRNQEDRASYESAQFLDTSQIDQQNYRGQSLKKNNIKQKKQKPQDSKFVPYYLRNPQRRPVTQSQPKEFNVQGISMSFNL